MDLNSPYQALSEPNKQGVREQKIMSNLLAAKGAVLNRLLEEFKIGCYNSLIQTLSSKQVALTIGVDLSFSLFQKSENDQSTVKNFYI